MIVLCDDMEKIGFRDPEQRRAKPSGIRLIEWLIWLERWRPLMRTVILMFSQRGEDVRRFLKLSAMVRSSHPHSVSSAYTSTRASHSVIHKNSANSPGESGCRGVSS